MDKIDPRRFREKIFQRLPELEISGKARIPNQQFWDFYRANKNLFYHACISPRKCDDGVWILVAHEFVDREAQHQAEIAEMVKRHVTACPACDVENQICVSIMRNGIQQFKFYCPACYGIYGGALPYALVAYCKNKGIEVCDREIVYQKQKHQ